MRIRQVETSKEFEQVIDDYITLGYKIKERGNLSTVVKKVEYGGILAHLLIFVLTVWFTLGLGNVAYALYKYYTGEEVLIKMRDTA
jgi:hypothetical protein